MSMQHSYTSIIRAVSVLRTSDLQFFSVIKERKIKNSIFLYTAHLRYYSRTLTVIVIDRLYSILSSMERQASFAAAINASKAASVSSVKLKSGYNL